MRGVKLFDGTDTLKPRCLMSAYACCICTFLVSLLRCSWRKIFCAHNESIAKDIIMTSAVPNPKNAGEEHVETLNEILHEEEADAKAGCGIMGRYPLISVISFAALGLAVGIVSNVVRV